MADVPLGFKTGTGANDNDVVLTLDRADAYDTFQILTTAGAVDVFVSLDGTNFATAPLSLSDLGATTSTPVLVTAANRVYGWRGKYRKIRVLQNGASAVTSCTLSYGSM